MQGISSRKLGFPDATAEVMGFEHRWMEEYIMDSMNFAKYPLSK